MAHRFEFWFKQPLQTLRYLFGNKLRRRCRRGAALQGLATSVETHSHFLDHIGAIYPPLQGHKPGLIQHFVHGGKVTASTCAARFRFGNASCADRRALRFMNDHRHCEVLAPRMRTTVKGIFHRTFPLPSFWRELAVVPNPVADENRSNSHHQNRDRKYKRTVGSTARMKATCARQRCVPAPRNASLNPKSTMLSWLACGALPADPRLQAHCPR